MSTSKLSVSILSAAVLLTSHFASAANPQNAPLPEQDPLVKQLDLSQDQINQIENLHLKLEENYNNITTNKIKNGDIIDIIKSDKWNEKEVKSQLAAISNVEQQVRYYKAKYYFDINHLLTPAQRKQIQDDMIQAAAQ